MEAIIAQDIFRLHNTGRGINGITLSVPPGQCVGILGPNGSGKTTLTRLVAGLDRIDRGYLSVLGASAGARSRSLRRRCGVALETPAHWDALTGRQNLCFFGRQYGLSESELNERVSSLLQQANLENQADDPVATYSFGMRRKLGIIEAIVADPDLLILDEPSAGSDTTFLEQLTLWVHSRCESGRTTWLADNDADWLARTATYVILLGDGQIQAQGQVRELTDSITTRQRIDILLEQPCSAINSGPRGMFTVHSFNCEDNRIVAHVHGGGDVPIELLRWIASKGGQVRSMEIRAVTLYEALMQQTADKEAKS